MRSANRSQPCPGGVGLPAGTVSTVLSSRALASPVLQAAVVRIAADVVVELSRCL